MPGQLKQKDIDFLVSYDKKDHSSKSIPLWVRLGALPLALVLAFGAAAGVLAVRTAQVKGETKVLQAFLKDENNKKQQELAQKAAKELADVNGKLADVVGLETLLKSYPVLGRQVFSGVISACGAKVVLNNLSYNSMTGVLKLDATAVNNAEAPLFIDRLKATKLFGENVTYYGFTGENNSFVFSANCPLKAGINA